MPKLLASMNIGKMNLYGRNPHRHDGIPESDAGMGVSRCIQDDDIRPAPGFLYPNDQFTFDVRLAEVYVRLELGRALPDFGFDVLQRGPAIDFRLPLAEQVQVWTVKE